MSNKPTAQSPLRVLVADDEAAVREAYRQVFGETDLRADLDAIQDLRARLFRNAAAGGKPPFRRPSFDAMICGNAAEVVGAVAAALVAGNPYPVVFLDMRMPPGEDGAWAATRIREIDPDCEIVICTAYSDVDPANIGGQVPPQEKISFLQKPFHPHEVRQMAVALHSKWRAERHIARLAYFDSLTGLPNREHTMARLGTVLQQAREGAHAAALLYIDLDNFKRINDTLGHSAGDELLKQCAARLREALDSLGDCGPQRPGAGDLGRLGGDEFVAMLPQIANREAAAAAADSIILALQQPVRLGHHEIVVTPSVGIAVSPEDGTDGATLLHNSDLAMYFSKRRGHGAWAFYDATMSDGALRRLTLEGKLRGALERQEFSLHYQPQFELASGTLSGLEALLRWTHPELGQVPVLEFIEIAEDTGLIIPIGEWVLRSACAQARLWRDQGLPFGHISVNVSGTQFLQRDFPELVARVLHESGLEAKWIELEITETVVMRDEAWAEKALAGLRAVGVSLAIDDFGIGYSSLGRLRHLAVDRLKVDRSFVSNLESEVRDRSIASAIIKMSRTLGIGVVAEGVETFNQMLYLQEQECESAQGYLFSRPLPLADAEVLLRRVAANADLSRTEKLRRLAVESTTEATKG
ncbi:MAG: EAL domain-containing protein [Gammaproteobacteria bacterium]|nr:EAL domain-containing protein [Gammaproteobacteria bacterium]